MYYIVITAILGVTATPETLLPKSYQTIAECNHAIFAEIIPNYRPPLDDEEIIFTCVKMDGA